jgi:hypothetical protein
MATPNGLKFAASRLAREKPEKFLGRANRDDRLQNAEQRFVSLSYNR